MSVLGLAAGCGSDAGSGDGSDEPNDMDEPGEDAGIEPEGDGGIPADKPLYLAATWVTDDNATNTYISVFDSLDIEEVDLKNAREVPGFGDAWVFDEWVFIASGDRPSVGRYKLAQSGTLELEQEVDFSNYGVQGAAFWDQQILSRTKAYLASGANREFIVWNPSTMEITGTVAWPEVDFGAGFETFHSYTDRGGVVVDGYYFHGLYGHQMFTKFGTKSVVVVWDIATDKVVSTIDVPCPMMDVASLGDDGKVYLSGWSYMPLSVIAGYTEKNCAARIDVATQKLDATWSLDYAAVTDGEQGSALRAVEGNEGIFTVFHGSGVPVVEGMDMWDLDMGLLDWELYSIDFASKAAAPTGIKMSDGSYYESHVGERYFVYLASEDDDTVVFERTASGYERRFRALGWMSRLFKLR